MINLNFLCTTTVDNGLTVYQWSQTRQLLTELAGSGLDNLHIPIVSLHNHSIPVFGMTMNSFENVNSMEFSVVIFNSMEFKNLDQK